LNQPPRAAIASPALSRASAAVRAAGLPPTAFGDVLPENNIPWGPFPAFPPRVRLAVLVGDTTRPEPYVIRVKVPGDVRLMPHTHPEDRVYTECATATGWAFRYGSAPRRPWPLGLFSSAVSSPCPPCASGPRVGSGDACVLRVAIGVRDARVLRVAIGACRFRRTEDTGGLLTGRESE